MPTSTKKRAAPVFHPAGCGDLSAFSSLDAAGEDADRAAPLPAQGARDDHRLARDLPAVVRHVVDRPAGTPRPIADRLVSEIHKAVSSSDVKDKLAASGIDTVTSTPELT